jgi:hypothetical protein
MTIYQFYAHDKLITTKSQLIYPIVSGNVLRPLPRLGPVASTLIYITDKYIINYAVSDRCKKCKGYHEKTLMYILNYQLYPVNA